MKYKEAVIKSMQDIAGIQNSVFVGYNLKYGSKNYGTLSSIPQDKIIEMPLAEQLMSGVSIGMAMNGYLPVLIFERQDFLLLALDQLINHLDKIKQISRGEFNPKVIIRAIVGGTKPFHPGPQHIQDFTDIFSHYSSMSVFEPSTSDEVLFAYEAALVLESSVFITERRDWYDND